MKIGSFLGEVRGAEAGVRAAARIEQAEQDGFASVWIPSGVAVDALQAATLGALRTTTIEIGTASVSIFGRHPITMASSVLTTQSVAQGRFVLGAGIGHRDVVDNVYGYSHAGAVGQLRDYLQALVPLLAGQAVDVHTDYVTARTAMGIQAPPTPVLLAAMGPKMLELAGAQADGTVAWMTGPRTLAAHTIPRIREAAERAGRPAPRVVVGLPVCVTDDAAAATELVAKNFAIYMQFPSYQAMVRMEGASGPEGVAVIGDEAVVADKLGELAGLGVTDFMAVPFSRGEDAARTTSFLTRQLSPVIGG